MPIQNKSLGKLGYATGQHSNVQGTSETSLGDARSLPGDGGAVGGTNISMSQWHGEVSGNYLAPYEGAVIDGDTSEYNIVRSTRSR